MANETPEEFFFSNLPENNDFYIPGPNNPSFGIYKNPIIRNGLSQSERFLKALDFSYAKIDEKTIADLIYYTYGYANSVRYYNSDNTEDGNWIPFIENDISTIVSIISLYNTNFQKEEFKSLLDSMKTANIADQEDIFKSFFVFQADILKLIDTWYLKSIQGHNLKNDIQGLIRAQLKDSLKQLIAYDKGAKEYFSLLVIQGNVFSGYDYSSFSPVWDLDFSEIDSDSSIYGNPTIVDLGDLAELPVTPLPLDPLPLFPSYKLATNSARPFFNAILDVVLASIDQLSANGAAYMDEAINNYPEHEPHFALYLSFLKLFGFAQEHLNELSEKHIDFYYREVLRLSEKEAIPDEVFVIFELAKNFDQQLLGSNTQLNAGKDATGKNLFYALKNDIIVNRATVADLKTLKIPTPVISAQVKTGTSFLAAPIANSTDGLGTDKDVLSWKPFGSEDSPKTQIGFAIASPQLLLKEGLRTVTLVMDLVNTFDTAAPTTPTLTDINLSGVELTSADGWLAIKLDPTTPTLEYTCKILRSSTVAKLSVQFTIDQDHGSIVAYNQKIHGGTFNTSWPIVKILVDNSAYRSTLRNLEFSKCQINVEVGKVGANAELLNLQGINSLILQNDDGMLDATKPFKPFSSKPKLGASLYIGSDEVFQKKLTSLQIFIDWMGVPADKLDLYYKGYLQEFIENQEYKVRIKLLDEFIWKDVVQVLDPGGPSPYEQQEAQKKILGETEFNKLLDRKKELRSGVNPVAAVTSGTDVTSHSRPSSIVSFNSDEYETIELLSSQNADPINFNTAKLGYINSVQIFDEVNAQLPYLIRLVQPTDGAPLFFFDAKRDPYQEPLTQFKAGQKRGFLKLELFPFDFGHSDYTNLYADAAIAKGKAVNKEAADAIKLPNEPYTPTIKQISLLYTSEAIIDFQASEIKSEVDLNQIQAAYDKRIDQVYHLYPFGETEIFPVNVQGRKPEFSIDGLTITSKLFPQFPYYGSNEMVAENEAVVTTNEASLPPEGNLYIGIKDLVPPQTLSLLFQFASDTGNSSVKLPIVKWSYLSDNRWIAFKDTNIVSDSTAGFLKSGIIVFDVPADATKNNTQLPSGFHWIKGSTPKALSVASQLTNIDVFNNLISVQAQAATAVFADNGNDPNKLRNPLLPNTITKLTQTNFAIKGVTQPYVSFGGKVAEQTSDFHLRVSEQLKHKNRAITLYDYERIVLENFPEIYRVRCINVKNRYSELAPGSVTIVLIPAISSGTRVENAFVLKTGITLRNDIKSFLEKLMNPFTALSVINPSYETVQAEFKVKFLPGFDAVFYTDKLNQEIKNFISPWATGNIESLRFGGKVIGSEVINFIEERNYVDYVEDFSLRQALFNESGTQPPIWLKTGLSSAVAETSISVLVTANKHLIQII